MLFLSRSTSVDVEVIQIPIQSVGHSPNLEPTLYRLHWEVLLHARPTFEGYHSFVHTELGVGVVRRLESASELR